MTHKYELIEIIGSPFVHKKPGAESVDLASLYNKAFEDRVALLYLTIHREKGWLEVLEEKYLKLNDRRDKTLNVVASLGQTLNEFNSMNMPYSSP